METSCFLKQDDYTFTKALGYQVFAGHCKQLCSNEGMGFGRRFVHFAFALAELTPIIGQVIALFETLIVTKLSLAKTESNEKPLSEQSKLENEKKKGNDIIKNADGWFAKKIDIRSQITVKHILITAAIVVGVAACFYVQKGGTEPISTCPDPFYLWQFYTSDLYYNFPTCELWKAPNA